MTKKQKRITDALMRVADEDSEGLLKAESIVEAAKSDKELHSEFQWDDSTAAYEYRLWQARHLIREYSVHVVIHKGERKEFSAFVSFKSDRGKKGGGYTPLKSVLRSKAKYQQLLNEALDDLRIFRSRYEALKELQPVFAAIDKLSKRKK